MTDDLEARLRAVPLKRVVTHTIHGIEAVYEPDYPALAAVVRQMVDEESKRRGDDWILFNGPRGACGHGPSHPRRAGPAGGGDGKWLRKA